MTVIALDGPWKLRHKYANNGKRTVRTFEYLKRIMDNCKHSISEIIHDFERARSNGDAEGQAAALHCARVCRDHWDRAVNNLEEVSAKSESALPITAPVLWLKRQGEDRKKTPPEFIRDVYQSWLGHGLTQAHILHLDKPLYNALHKWLHQPQGGVPGAPNNRIPDWLDLPTKAEATTRQLRSMGVLSDDHRSVRSAVYNGEIRERFRTPEIRKSERLYRAAMRRSSRIKNQPVHS